MPIQFKPGMPAALRATSSAASAHAVRNANAKRFAEHLVMPAGDDASRGDDGARRDRMRPSRVVPTRLEHLEGRLDGRAGELTWHLTNGLFAGLVVNALTQQGTLFVTLIPANAEQRALAARYGPKIEEVCARHFAGHIVVTLCDAPHLA